MNTHDITLQLKVMEKIVIHLLEPLSTINCYSNAAIFFLQDNNQYELANDSTFSLRDNIQELIWLLSKALKNELHLHPSLSNKSTMRDIGYFFNEFRQSKPDIVYETDENGEAGDWVGMRYMLGGVKVAAWIYNNDEGDIIFSITPSFPGKPTYHFQQEPFSEDEKTNSLWYEQWIKNYKPILIRKIPKEIAKKWLNQAENILKTIDKNTHALENKK